MVKLAPGRSPNRQSVSRACLGCCRDGLGLSHQAFREGGVSMPRPCTAEAGPSRALQERAWEVLAMRVDSSGSQVACLR